MSIELQRADTIFVDSVQLKNNTFYVDMPLCTNLDNLQLGEYLSEALKRFLA